jgi:hypothetical protein
MPHNHYRKIGLESMTNAKDIEHPKISLHDLPEKLKNEFAKHSKGREQAI